MLYVGDKVKIDGDKLLEDARVSPQGLSKSYIKYIKKARKQTFTIRFISYSCKTIVLDEFMHILDLDDVMLV